MLATRRTYGTAGVEEVGSRLVDLKVQLEVRQTTSVMSYLKSATEH